MGKWHIRVKQKSWLTIILNYAMGSDIIWKSFSPRYINSFPHD